MEQNTKTLSLVLGSGGARGLAHIGVIRCLEERGYHIRSIAGASMGALIGGIYATGKLEDYAHWVCSLQKMDVVRLLDPNLNLAGGIFRGEKIIQTLRELIGDHRIEDLPIRYTAVCTDLKRQREVWIRSGSLFDAIRASISIPTLFTPVLSAGRLLLDGGLVNPVPVSATLEDTTNLTIAVDVNATGNHTQEKTAEGGNDNNLTTFDILGQSFETMQSMVTRFQLAANPPDLLITIPARLSSLYAFYKAEFLIDYGYRTTANYLDHFISQQNGGS